MYGKIKRSMAKFILVMGLTVLVGSLFGLTAAPAMASSENVQVQDSSSTTNAKGTTSTTVSGDVDEVLSANASFIGKSKKVKACKAYAEKREQQAPPRDPQAFCKGKLKVKLFGKIVASCPPGYLGAKVTLGVSLRQVVKARSFAKSIASGRVRTWARFKIRDLAKIKGKTYIECVKIPVVTPPPPPPPPPTCETHPEMPGCVPPPPPPPPVVEKPLYAQFGEFNDLEVNWTDDHCVTVNFPAGHTGKVFWTAKFGSFAVSTKDAQDMVEVCSFYKAPSEVPAGGTDTITVTATDKTTGHSVTLSTDPFVIHPTAGHPEKAQQ